RRGSCAARARGARLPPALPDWCRSPARSRPTSRKRPGARRRPTRPCAFGARFQCEFDAAARPLRWALPVRMPRRAGRPPGRILARRNAQVETSSGKAFAVGSAERLGHGAAGFEAAEALHLVVVGPELRRVLAAVRFAGRALAPENARAVHVVGGPEAVGLLPGHGFVEVEGEPPVRA